MTPALARQPLAPATFGNLVTAILVLSAGYTTLFVAPTELTMGHIQRIFYFHVASAWTAFLAFFVVFLFSVAYLIRRKPQWDWLALSSAEVGLIFTTVVLVTGPLWAKPVWLIWWTWDARLTTTFILWLLYVSYLLLRNLITDPSRRAVVAAVFGIFAFLDVPLVYMSIRWWRTQHPPPVIGGGEGSGIDPIMWRVLLFCFLAMLALGFHLIRRRYALESLRHETAELRFELDGRATESAVARAAAPQEAR